MKTIEFIKKIHNEMKKIVIDCGIQEPQYNFIIKKIEKESEEYHSELLEWLINFKVNEYYAVDSLLKQFSGWDQLKLQGVNHLPEQVLLRKKQKALREAWHGRPIRKKKKHGQVRNVQKSNTKQNSS